MALERGKLTNVVQVTAGTTVGIITVNSSKKVDVKSIGDSHGHIPVPDHLHRYSSALQAFLVLLQITYYMLT